MPLSMPLHRKTISGQLSVIGPTRNPKGER
jgi:hypothetical protein